MGALLQLQYSQLKKGLPNFEEKDATTMSAVSALSDVFRGIAAI
jgi:hypothetical protein